MKNRLFAIFCQIILLAQTACIFTTAQQISPLKNEPNNAPLMSQPESEGKTFSVPTIYWAVQMPVLQSEWAAVFAGTVQTVKSEKETGMGGHLRRFKSGTLKVERVFLDLPGGETVKAGDRFEGESFVGLKRGDKVIVFNSSTYYEGGLYRHALSGTNSELGFKIKTWNDSIVAAVEKAVRCWNDAETAADTRAANSPAQLRDCLAERDRMILENKELAEIWRRADPQGFQYLLEMREIMRESTHDKLF